MKSYKVQYTMQMFGEIKSIDILALNKEDAWSMATHVMIPEIEGCEPYSAWVDSVTYKNGKSRTFNSFEGKPY